VVPSGGGLKFSFATSSVSWCGLAVSIEEQNRSGSNLARLVCQDRLQDRIKRIKGVPEMWPPSGILAASAYIPDK
jgi:hypothetical protein